MMPNDGIKRGTLVEQLPILDDGPIVLKDNLSFVRVSDVLHVTDRTPERWREIDTIMGHELMSACFNKKWLCTIIDVPLTFMERNVNDDQLPHYDYRMITGVPGSVSLVTKAHFVVYRTRLKTLKFVKNRFKDSTDPRHIRIERQLYDAVMHELETGKPLFGD